MPYGEYRTGRRPNGDRAMTDVERQSAHRRRARMITRREAEDMRRRKRYEKDAEKWTRYYCHDPEAKPNGRSHREIVKGVQRAVSQRTGVAVAAPRGDGKTTKLTALAWYLVATGVCRFPVMVRYTHKHAKSTFKRSWLPMLSGDLGRRLQADYPELTQPFEVSTNPKALEQMRWLDSEDQTGATVDSTNMLIVLPDSRGAIACVSAKSDVKGMHVVLKDGTRLRPDLLLIDDAQDADRADNPEAVKDQIDVLENIFLGLSGPQVPMMVFVACTVEAIDDVSCHWINRPGFTSVRVPRIVKWPGGKPGGDWPAEDDSTVRRLWVEWWELWKSEGHRAKNRFYRKNRKEMIQGMVVSWKHRVKKKRDVDAYDGAMFDYFDLGASVFSRAQQNEPITEGVSIYTITPDVINSRAVDREPGVAPDWSVLRVAATDVNYSYGLTWGVGAFGRDQTAAVLGYGVHKMRVRKEATEAEIAQAIFENLTLLGRQLAALPCRPEAWTVDAGGSAFDVVNRFAVNSLKVCGLQATPSTGRGARNYRPYGKTVVGVPREQCHLCRDERGRKWVAFNADYWREQAQRGWTGTPGAPGSCTLPKGNHTEFATQICREQLQGKGEVGGAMQWVWHTAPGQHDYGDVMAMMYMLAAFNGIGTGGGEVKRPQRRRRRKVRHVQV